VEAAVAEFGAASVDTEKDHTVECDIYSPCALGAVLNESTIPELHCAAVCGSANNQLAEAADHDRLAERGILYAPDYVVNAGGVINIAGEAKGEPYDHDATFARIATIHDTTLRIFAIADQRGITPAEAADQLAEERIAAARSH
jgi:leucine dehydrogenase